MLLFLLILRIGSVSSCHSIETGNTDELQNNLGQNDRLASTGFDGDQNFRRKCHQDVKSTDAPSSVIDRYSDQSHPSLSPSQIGIPMSALGHKQTSETYLQNVRFTPDSGHKTT
jgi:hypothetical protein